jgi:hypothetical protein
LKNIPTKSKKDKEEANRAEKEKEDLRAMMVEFQKLKDFVNFPSSSEPAGLEVATNILFKNTDEIEILRKKEHFNVDSEKAKNESMIDIIANLWSNVLGYFSETFDQKKNS